MGIIIIYGLFYFIDSLFNKLKVYDWLHLKASGLNTMFFYNLLSCRLCSSFWLCFLITLLYSVFCGFNHNTLFLPFAACGLIQITERK